MKLLSDFKFRRLRLFLSLSRLGSDDFRSFGFSLEFDDDVVEERKKEKKVEVYIGYIYFGDF